MKTVTLTDLANWQKQAKQEHIGWYEATKAIKSERDREVVAAGFDAGFRAALSVLKLHADLKLGKACV